MARHSAWAVKKWFGGWKVKCSTCGNLPGSYHLKAEASRAASHHR